MLSDINYSRSVQKWFRPTPGQFRKILRRPFPQFPPTVVRTMKTLYQRLFATSVLAIILLFAGTGSAFASSSLGPQQSTVQVAKACSPTYTVKPRDKIETIARKCRVRQKAVIRANGGSNQLVAGAILYFGGSAPPSTPTPQPNTPGQTPLTNPQLDPYDRDKGPLPTPNS